MCGVADSVPIAKRSLRRDVSVPMFSRKRVHVIHIKISNRKDALVIPLLCSIEEAKNNTFASPTVFLTARFKSTFEEPKLSRIAFSRPSVAASIFK